MGMVSGEEAYELMKVMKQENSPLHHILSDFNAVFPRPSLCTSLFLRQDKLVLTGTERLVAFSVLRQTYASQPLSANPFLRFLVSIAGDDEAEKFERVFILQLLESSDSSSIKEALPQIEESQKHLNASLRTMLQRMCWQTQMLFPLGVIRIHQSLFCNLEAKQSLDPEKDMT